MCDVCVCVCSFLCMPPNRWVQERMLDPLELKFQRVGSHCEGAQMEPWSLEGQQVLLTTTLAHQLLGWILSKGTVSLFSFSLRHFKRKTCVVVSVFYGGCLVLYFGKSFLSQGIWEEKTKVTEWRIGERSSSRQLQVRQMDWLLGRPEKFAQLPFCTAWAEAHGQDRLQTPRYQWHSKELSEDIKINRSVFPI